MNNTAKQWLTFSMESYESACYEHGEAKEESLKAAVAEALIAIAHQLIGLDVIKEIGDDDILEPPKEEEE